NSYGQLGQGNLATIGDGVGVSVSAAAAIALGSGRTARAIAAGDAHTCALLDDGGVKCWGAGGNGRLGSGDTADLGDEPNEMGNSLTPVLLGTGRTAIAITAGASHTCALLDNYAVKCWGSGADGRLGYGNQNDLGDQLAEMGDSLAAVSLGTGRTARAVVAAAAHTCAVLDDDTVKCWGNGGSGRRGSGSTLRAGHSTLTIGDNLSAIDLGSSRTINAFTEPGRPTSLSATAGDSQASLTWTAPTVNGGSAVTDYVIESSIDGGATWSVTSDAVSTTASALISGLTNSSTYRFRVSALNVVAMGAASGTSANVVPFATPATATTTTTTAPSTTTTTISAVTTPSTTPTNSIVALPIAPEPTAVRVIPRLVLPSFSPNATLLNAQQQQRLLSYSANLRRGDKVTCVGYANPNPFKVVSLLSIKRAESVCVYLAKRVRGIVTKIDAQFPTAIRTGPNSVTSGLPTNMERRVVVLATNRK
ncbi:MAG: fibronectin type III domain-containing protein, partial [Ilumatobacteraceae bacterium]